MLWLFNWFHILRSCKFLIVFRGDQYFVNIFPKGSFRCLDVRILWHFFSIFWNVVGDLIFCQFPNYWILVNIWNVNPYFEVLSFSKVLSTFRDFVNILKLGQYLIFFAIFLDFEIQMNLTILVNMMILVNLTILLPQMILVSLVSDSE